MASATDFNVFLPFSNFESISKTENHSCSCSITIAS